MQKMELGLVPCRAGKKWGEECGTCFRQIWRDPALLRHHRDLVCAGSQQMATPLGISVLKIWHCLVSTRISSFGIRSRFAGALRVSVM